MHLDWKKAYSARIELPGGIIVRTEAIPWKLYGKPGWMWKLEAWMPGGKTESHEAWATCEEDAITRCEDTVQWIADRLREAD